MLDKNNMFNFSFKFINENKCENEKSKSFFLIIGDGINKF